MACRRAAPKKGHMSLKVSAFHNVPQFLQAIILIPKRGNKRIQRMQMISKIFAWHFSPRAKVPNSGFAGNVRAVWTRPIRLTLPICLGWLLLNDARDLVRVERITGKPKCGESSASAVRFRCRCSRGHNQTHPPRNPLPLPCRSPRQGTEFPCHESKIRPQAVGFAGHSTANGENIPVISRPAGKFAVVGAGPAIAPYNASLPATRSRVAANAKRKTASGTRTDCSCL